MPFPTSEQVRAAVEKQLHDGLAKMPGDWMAQLPDGEDVGFSTGEGGEIVTFHCLSDAEIDALPPGDHEIERTYKFRVRVELMDEPNDPALQDVLDDMTPEEFFRHNDEPEAPADG